ncbi:MAG: hypothetical protein K9I59_02215 [Chlorobium sp.]|uniref:hypothetical protein n=1 Tax=Chlorobium sp. TaxID=1095 RepID=UPI0025C12A59|nr:hypothetical protein [Chlorobium sp.]MCF8215668.1 hypothetical protein [Chlorobium sp.]MCF8271911.1 hypothetical protein [Chlorobium sp.]MCF8286877.1 hypothetical protein [Chlorobium sp.]MCF8291858.1 hypothetical protein [Chlorobium sp.]MCF8384503.1 hypothetical protein [Chlorobium sp.]
MSITWERIVLENRETILHRWHKQGLDLFSGKMAPGTPLSEAFADAMGMIIDGFDEDGDFCREGVLRMARILALHPFRPSQSMSLFLELLVILREFAPDGEDIGVCRERVERITLYAFDSFVEHREKIYQLKVEESRSAMHMQLRRGRS